MPGVWALKARIKSIESAQQIIHSMKMVSAAKLRQTQSALRKLSPYEEGCRKAFIHAVSCARCSSPLMREPSENSPTCYVVILGNRGLCGSYNNDMVKFAGEVMAEDKGEYFTIVCGKWGADVLSKQGWNIERRFDGLSDAPTAEECEEISAYLKELFLSGRAGRVVILAQKQAGMSQEPRAFPFLPPVLPEKGTNDSMIFEPDEKTLVETLSQMYVSNVLHRVVLEARVSEHLARMTASTDNADDILKDLRQQLNRARQAQITTQISEVVGGANALTDTQDHSHKPH